MWNSGVAADVVAGVGKQIFLETLFKEVRVGLSYQGEFEKVCYPR